MNDRRLLRNLAWAIMIKLLLLAALWWMFVPLTLGTAWLPVIIESVYVMTGKVIYKDMTRFWDKLFGINFALGVVAASAGCFLRWHACSPPFSWLCGYRADRAGCAAAGDAHCRKGITPTPAP